MVSSQLHQVLIVTADLYDLAKKTEVGYFFTKLTAILSQNFLIHVLLADEIKSENEVEFRILMSEYSKIGITLQRLKWQLIS